MLSTFNLYLLLRLPAISKIALGLGLTFIFGLTIILVVAAIFIYSEKDSYSNYDFCAIYINFLKRFKIKILFLIGILLLCLQAFIPSDMNEIAAIYLIPKIVNNESMKNIPDNTAKFLNLKLTDWIKENSKQSKVDIRKMRKTF